MAISLFDGPPGSGKSLLATYLGIEALTERTNVLANFPFDMNYFRRKKRIGKFEYVSSSNLSPDLLVKWAFQNHKRNGKRAKKCQTILIIDEAEMIFNSRSWDNGKRFEWIKFLSNHRHFNYDIYLICPMDRMIDRQIRGTVTTEYRCRAITGFGIIGKVVSFLFGGLFCAVPYNYAAKVKLFPPHFYKLHKRKANVYDTMRMFEGMEGYQESEGEKENAKGDKKDCSCKALQILLCYFAMRFDCIRFRLQKAS